MMISAMLASTMIAGSAAAEELTAYPGDTIEVEYGSGFGGGGLDIDEEDEGWRDTIKEQAEVALSGGGGGGCRSVIANVAGKVAGAFGFASSITGRATAGLQGSQIVQAAQQILCLTEEVKIGDDQLGEQRRMTARIGSNAANGIRRIERGARQAIGAMDRDLYGRDADVVMHDRYQSGMPEGWTFEDAAEHTRTMRMQTDLATRDAAATAAASNYAVNDALAISSNALDLSQGADGQTGAIQAQTQMIRAQISVDAAKHASDTAMATASLRMEEERRASEVIADQKLERFWGKTADAGTPIKRAVFE
jgi:hypothetical protein